MGNIVSTVIVDYPHVQILGIMKATVCTFVTYKLDRHYALENSALGGRHLGLVSAFFYQQCFCTCICRRTLKKFHRRKKTAENHRKKSRDAPQYLETFCASES